ncbi:hypothetical protein [Micromonospora cathayae]|uniref:Uncharacterized protein n=1 Tax=Micromonospora cathayae TaxID=3028804 RepID=A0ABY7ZLV9_9ACTN|nr:hypothetical protein [Micromonospora sp. HUAS 3]WDZ83990.1 hypothetical protein PVK37_26540 [Micromonospora sp. HUAS 3]
MNLALIDVAQCATCSGVLVPAGDDWRHREGGTGCTELATPVICRRDDCGLPAAVGSEACAGHAGALLWAVGVGSQCRIATV